MYTDEASEVLLFRKITAGEYSMDENLWGSVSMQAKDLVVRLLQVNPERRYTMKEVLESPFMKMHKDVLNKPS